MSINYDNWERLVKAVLRREELWKMFHDPSPSISSISSDISLASLLNDLPYDISIHGGLSPHQHGNSSNVAEVASRLVLFKGSNLDFRIKDILNSSIELLGKGKFGSAYKAVTGNETKIVVKKLKAVSIPETKFKEDMVIIGKVRHKNVSPLRAYYSSEDVKLLFYDYYSNGSLCAMLHGKIDKTRAHLDWEARLRIAIDAAIGIAHIHTHRGGNLVHGNIKASNIFVTSKQNARVSDHGLANVIAAPVLQTGGYHAPEVKKTQDISQASDVYSFGIVLLELLTRKCPLPATGLDKAVDLVKLVNSVNSKDQIAEIFDAELLGNPNIGAQMIKMLQIAMNCVAKTPKQRPKMVKVSTMLKDVSVINTAKKLVYIKDLRPVFDRGYLSRSGIGTFGSPYGATWDHGSTIFVERLNEVRVTSQEFQQDIIGRMSENIAALRPHYSLRSESPVLCGYYFCGSVSDMLYRKKGENDIFLDGNTRIRIAIGTARSIGHIHTQVGKKHVHGNVTASNILLYAPLQFGCDSGGGLRPLLRLTTVPVEKSAGYCAPEDIDCKKVSQASDVYSFGIVLLELLTGKRPTHSGDGHGINLLVRWVIDNYWTRELYDPKLQGDPATEWAIVQSLRVALSCVESIPKHRPKMSEVVKMLDDISDMNKEAVISHSIQY